MPKIKVNDIDLYYEIHGEGPPLLLIYGLAGRGNGFSHQVSALSREFQIILFDNRGVGETDQPETPYSIPQMADDAAGLLAELGIESAHVFGISMGGMIAQEVALRHPGRVNRLALGCTHSGVRHCTPSPKWVTDIFKSLPGKPRAQIVRECIPFNFSPHTIEHRPEFIEAELPAMIANLQQPYSYMLQVRAIYDYDTRDRLGQITAPTLVLTGLDDQLIPPENSRDLVARIPGAKLVEIEHAGHLFFLEQADEVNAILREFFL
ncbi:MAG: alpha/beta fold hydrolase [Blastocatellia bacterium]|nr:alpha/beta fold hydrolase [Blastocatellia bacterium]